MFTRSRPFCVVLCSLIFSTCPLLYSQANGSFTGTVSDKTGSVIRGATVKLLSQGTGVSREMKTDDTGHYLFSLLPVAIYTLRVEAQGFQAVEQKDVRLQVDEHRELNFTMAPASVTSTVEVSATEVAVQTSNATLGQVITEQQVAELPLNGRNFVQLATLAPGTTAETSPVSFFNGAASSEASTRGSYSLSVGGSRAQETDWMLDGNDNNQLDEGGIAIFPSIDAIQEFKVLTYNYSAEWGERAGPTVLVTTKSGSNQFHGSLFEFFRNTVLDARSYFAATREKFNLNQYGGSLGGPIRKDKTFFFFDYQGKAQRKGVAFTGQVPTAAMMTGDFTLDPYGNPRGPSNPYGFGNLVNPYATGTEPTNFQCVPGTSHPEPVNPDGSQPLGALCHIVPSAMINSIGQSMIKLYPGTNTSNAALAFNFADVPVRKLNENTFDIRLDHNFSTKDTVFARFSYDQATNFVPGGSPGYAVQNPFGSTQYITNHGRNAAISETHIFSPNNINQAAFGYNRIFNHILSFGTGSCEAANLGIPGANLDSICPPVPASRPDTLNQSSVECVSCGMTSAEVTSYWSLGDRGYAPYQGGTNVYSISDSFDMIRGKHDIRVGGVFRANQMNVLTNGFQDGFVTLTGQYTGDAMADLLLGQYAFAAHDQTFLGATTGRRWKLFRPFVQDDWRVTPSLTLNLGLAWALATPETEAENRQSNFNFQTGQFLLPTGSPELAQCITAGPIAPFKGCVASSGRVGVQFDWTALEPRIGLAWKVMGSQNTVLRAGYAIFHDAAWNQGGQGLWQGPPFYAESDLFGPCLPFGSTTCGLSAGFPLYTSPPNPQTFTGTIQTANTNFKQGQIQQYNLNVEHQLPGNVVLTAGYAGSRSTNILVGQLNQNVASPSACGVVSGYTLGCGIPNFPYVPFQVVSINDSIGSARYDSLQVKAETKSSRYGLYALVGYTYSRTFDSGFPDGLGTNPGATYWPLPGTKKLDWGLSQLNLNDSFTLSLIYDLPFGKGKHFGSGWSAPMNTIFGNWQVNLIERATSGFPLFVVDTSDPSGVFFYYNGLTVQRPNQVGNPYTPGPVAANSNVQCHYIEGQPIPGTSLVGIAPTRVHTLANWFNPCAFEKAPTGELGSAVRAPVYSPRFVNTDFSAIKNFPLPFREGMNLQFRAEFFNLLNHPQYFLNGVADTGEQDINTPSSFGVINQTVNNPRLIQFALKLTF